MSDINVQTFSGKVNVANNLKVGTNHFFVDAQNNNVGIGTNNPTHTLDVHGDANVGVLTATFLHGDGSNIQNIVSSQWEGSPGDPIYYGSNVGIATTSAPTRTLEVGSNLYVEDTGSNVLVVDGNVAATSITIGDATIVASQGLDHVTNENNTTTQVVQFNNPTTGFVTASNAVIGGTLLLQNFALSQSYGLENVTDVNNTTGDTIISSNATTGFQATANVAVGRDALVTGNVTVGKDLTVSEEAAFSSNVTIAKDLEVSGNVTNLDVLSNVNLLSVSNVVSIRKDSNVVTEFPRSKKLIKYPRVALTSAAQTVSGYEGYFTSQDSSTLNSTSSRQAWGFFDSVTNPNDASGGPHIVNATDRFDGSGNYIGGDTFAGISGDWITIQLPVKIQLSRVHTWSRYDYQRNPVDATILGSLDGTNWTTIALWSGRNFKYNDPNPYDIQTNEYYNYFAFVFEKIESGSSGKYINFNEIELFGVPEYDPDADGVDVKVTSYPNVPNTNWLEVYYDAKDLTGVPSPVLDLSGNSRNGTLNGGVSVSDGAFDIPDGGNISATLASIPSEDFVHTVSLWVKFEGDTLTTSYPYVYFLGNTSNYSGFALYVAGATAPNKLHVSCWLLDYPIDFTFTDHKWYHVTYTYNGGGWGRGTVNAYVDGIEYGLGINRSTGTEGTTPTLPTSNVPLRIGTSSTGGSFDGKIANFRLFNRAITSDEVWQLYAYQKEYFGHGDLSMTLKAGRLGIGTSEPKAALDVRGDVQVGGIITSNNPAFNVYRDAGDITVPAGQSETPVVWNQVRFNRGNCYDSSTGIFHVPVDGMYFFSVFGMTDAITNAVCSFRFELAPPNGSFDYIHALWPYQYVVASSSHIHASGSFVYFLEAGSSFRVAFHGTELLARGNSHNGFSGFLIG